MENSKVLLQRATQILDIANVAKDSWAIGGGTVLSFYYNHRLSKDIDIFIDDPQLLSSLSPRVNDVAEGASDYDEMATYISLAYPEGKIDFIVASQITDFPPKKYSFLYQNVYLEDAVEIISKKMFYRGEAAMARDIFDLAVVYCNRPDDVIRALSTMPTQVHKFYETLHKMQKKNETTYSFAQKASILADGLEYIDKEYQICENIELELAKMKIVTPKLDKIKRAKTSYTR